MTNTYGAPRPAHRLVIATFGLYRRYPLLFLILAAGVIVPYQAIVFAFTGAGPLAQGSLGFGTGTLLTVVDWVLIGPLISALHVHAVAEAGAGREPQLGPVSRRGLSVLPVVAAASIISGLAIGLGLVALVVPGIILILRWNVVAQEAAIEHEGWLPALRRSAQLTAGHYGHIFVFGIYVGVIVVAPALLVGLAFGHDSTTAASFSVGVIVAILTRSFGALGAALLYFDLRGRLESSAAAAPAGDAGPSGGSSSMVRQSWDPRGYSDQDRPNGWYIDLETPTRMRYWGQGEPPGWGADTRTPRKIRREWREKHEGGSEAE